MSVLAIAAAGFVLGVLVARWWALGAAFAVAVYVAAVSEVEVSRWFLAFVYGALAAIAIAIGVAIRRLAARA